jgi:antitoxin PrlF
MSSNLEVESTLTDKYQTTIPESIRTALKLRKRDKIRFALEPDGTVTLNRASPAEKDDPLITEFLQLLAEEMVTHPERIRAALSPALIKRARALTKGIKVKLGAPLAEG